MIRSTVLRMDLTRRSFAEPNNRRRGRRACVGDPSRAWPARARGILRRSGQIGAAPGAVNSAAPARRAPASAGLARPGAGRWRAPVAGTATGPPPRLQAVGHRPRRPAAPRLRRRRTRRRDSRSAASPAAATFSATISANSGSASLAGCAMAAPSIAVRAAMTCAAPATSRPRPTPSRAACSCRRQTSPTLPRPSRRAASSGHAASPRLHRTVHAPAACRQRASAWPPGSVAGLTLLPWLGRCYPPAAGCSAPRPAPHPHSGTSMPEDVIRTDMVIIGAGPVRPVRRVRGRPPRHEVPPGRQSRQDRRPVRRALSGQADLRHPGRAALHRPGAGRPA